MSQTPFTTHRIPVDALPGLVVVFEFFSEGPTCRPDPEIQRRIDAGELEHFWVRAQGVIEGVPLGVPGVLADCIYTSIQAFLGGNYAANMKRNAISSALETLEELVDWRDQHRAAIEAGGMQ